jgi:hypothetical protein
MSATRSHWQVLDAAFMISRPGRWWQCKRGWYPREDDMVHEGRWWRWEMRN